MQITPTKYNLSLSLTSLARFLALPPSSADTHAYEAPTLTACFKAQRPKAPGRRPWATLAEEIPSQPGWSEMAAILWLRRINTLKKRRARLIKLMETQINSEDVNYRGARCLL